MIYFDNSATTPIAPEVLDAMLPYLREEYGNPSSKYYTKAENAKRAVETAREQVSLLLGCEPEEVIFTSGATESNNMVIKGVADQHATNTNALIITSPVEHPSVIETVNYLKTKGYDAKFLNVDKFGRINPGELEEVLLNPNKHPFLTTLIWGNNETGSLNDIASVLTICNEHGVLLHTDATQVLGKMKLDTKVNFLSCSSHKIHGPKGIGACMIRKHRLGYKTKLTPLLHGGGQENDYRSGTLSVHNIVGFGKAAEIARKELDCTIEHLTKLEEYLRQRLQSKLPSVVSFNSDETNKIPGVVNLQFSGVNNELLIKHLSDKVAISTGSACSSSKPSHVLQSIGLDLAAIRSSVRISLSRYNTKEEIDQFIQLLQ